MAAIITSTKEEKSKVLSAINTLGRNPIVRHMSYAMLAAESGLSTEKVRIAIAELINNGAIIRCTVNGNSKSVPRYYYVVRTE